MTPYRRHGRPFFEQDNVIHLIDLISEADDLTIYVGAGVTIDKGGPSWMSLIQRAGSREEFRKRGILSDTGLDVLTSQLTPLEAATAVAGYYRRQTGAGPDAARRARASLITAIRSHLYPDALWNQGRLTAAVAEFVTVRAMWQRKTRVITTNYDCFLENEIKDCAELGAELIGESEEMRSAGFAEPRLERQMLDDTGDSQDGATVEIIYLHGRIDEDPQKAVEGDLAVTELDYGLLRPRVVTRLTEIFKTTSLLILGASVTDPPLLAALQETTESSAGKCRVAVMPVASMLGACTDILDEEQTKALAAHHKTRLEEFAVSLAIPDSFGQVAQFCIELTAAAQFWTAAGDPYSTNPEVRYGPRLRSWWESWSRNRFDNGVYRQALHRYLGHTCTRIRNEFNLTGASKDETLKLEIWARWSPSTTNRSLKLYASSAALWEDPSVMRYADISIVSEYPAVEALTAGRPLLRTLQLAPESLRSVDSPKASRWTTFLSVPVDVAVNGLPITVGVVTLASMSEGPRSGLNESDAARLEMLTDWLKNVGLSALRLRRSSPSTAPSSAEHA